MLRDRKGKVVFTMEYPWGFMHEDYAEALGVIGLKASNHEFNGSVILFN